MEIVTGILAIGGLCGAVSTIIALVILIVKPIRNKFAAWVTKTANTNEFSDKFDDINDKLDQLTGLVSQTIEQNKKLQEDIDTLSMALQASLRNQILILYYDCRKKKYITKYELECLDKLYENYINLRGNSFIKACYGCLTTQLEVRDD